MSARKVRRPAKAPKPITPEQISGNRVRDLAEQIMEVSQTLWMLTDDRFRNFEEHADAVRFVSRALDRLSVQIGDLGRGES